MSDEPQDRSRAIDYQTPGAPDAGRSQWVTDEHSVTKWLVGCLLIGTVFGTVVGGIVAVLGLAVGC